MAENSIIVAEDQLICSVCLDVLKDPVTIPCGHSYCKNCIANCWTQAGWGVVYSCPQCRQTYNSKPALNKNVMLAEMVEKLKHDLKSAPSYAGPGDVECSVCVGKKCKAVKSCLMCLNSYCQNHLEQHDNFFKDKRHNLINASGRLGEMICAQHDRLREIYCHNDQKCVCLLCVVDGHTDHHTVSIETERAEKQKQLLDIQRNTQKRIQEKEKEIQEVKEAVTTHKLSAQTAKDNCQRMFTELFRFIVNSRMEFMQLIRQREISEVSEAEGLLKELGQEIEVLKRRNTELEQLLQTDDNIHFLQSFRSVSVPPASVESSCFIPLLSYDDVCKDFSVLKKKFEDFCKEATDHTYIETPYMELVTTEVKSRDELLQYSCPLTFDSNTAHKYLHLSKDNRVATFFGTDQRYPDHPDRFQDYSQVLCRESVCGRCYWEVEWSGEAGVGISVSYKSVNRKQGLECVFGFNDQSWRLSCSNSRYTFKYNQRSVTLQVPSNSFRIGVYVDYDAGNLSFFSVSDTLHLIHRVQTLFFQPLYPGFAINFGSSVKLTSAGFL